MRSPIPFRRHRRSAASCPFTAGEFRLALLGGILLGLVASQSTGYWPAPRTSPESPLLAAADPYRESKRSRAILEAQEAAPAPVRISSGRGFTAGGGYVRVIDGDTFVYAGARIRIADIDTPEVHGRCPEESALAALATRRLEVLLAQGPFELHGLPSGRDHDRYGRELRIVTRGGRSLGDVLVAEGLARTWSGRREPWCVR
jgi:endonuclease YncB( thermonuclease family)